MAGINKGVPWFAATLAVGIVAAVRCLPEQSGDPGAKAVRPVTDAVDAAGVLYREMPVYLVSEHGSSWRNPAGAGMFLTSHTISQQELDLIPKTLPPDCPEWRGVLYVKSVSDQGIRLSKHTFCGGRFLDYRTFLICGDPALTRKARQILAAVNVQPLNDADQTGDECSKAGGDGFRILRR
jgi:hypothetical protein